MFTWICPKCGMEVSPSYNECPQCAGKLDQPATGEPLKPVEPPAFGGVTAPPVPPPAPAPVPAQSLPPTPYQPPRSGMPGWLVTLLVAGGLIAVVGGGVYLYNLKKTPPAPAAQVTLPGRAESAPLQPHPYAKYIELSGVRITEEHDKPQVAVLVVNHSGAELPPLDILVHLKAVTATGQSEPEATFTLKVPSLAPYSAKDLTTGLQTKKRAYELADWQFLRSEFQILTPPAA
ncbi:MAG: hypothetical protein IT160_08700 [Bryobacterales bacterium]|nr:hypothetical protein [Bryobacterales bacterium]